MIRGHGRTTRQMKTAPSGAVYVWVNGDLFYPRQLAESLGRHDLRILSPATLGLGELRGCVPVAVVVDHAAWACLTAMQWNELRLAQQRAASFYSTED